MSWHKRMFEPRKTAVETACRVCGRPMWLPPSKSGKYTSCGANCRAADRRAREIKNTRACETCGKHFSRPPTKSRPQRFCSQACNTASREAINGPKAAKTRARVMREMRDDGKWTILTGPDHPNWKGGHEAHLQRAKESGKRAEWQRNYYQRNPEKVRGYTSRKRRKSLPKLRSGTIARIKLMQRNKCAICRRSVKTTYHLDHIVPLARGGTHEPRNLQILCPKCNVKKGAKDPIDYMRQVGRLL